MLSKEFLRREKMRLEDAEDGCMRSTCRAALQFGRSFSCLFQNRKGHMQGQCLPQLLRKGETQPSVQVLPKREMRKTQVSRSQKC